MKTYKIYKCTNSINDKTYTVFTNKPLEKRKNDVEYKLKQSQRMKEWWDLRKVLGT